MTNLGIRVLSESCITHVIHIGDIHVRIGNQQHSRAQEYATVFSSFLEKIHLLPCVRDGRCLLVIAGDVFHNKGRLETEGATVFFRWINQILEVVPILVICGNHDFRQEDPTYCDMIEMFTTPYSAPGRHPIHYLRDTGLYRWGNIGFGVVSVKDTLRAFNTRGMVDDLPPFPLFPAAADGGGPELVRRVAIFHGSISQSALPNGRLMPTEHGYPLEWFRGYDIAMLGDNHKQQLHKDALDGTLQWGYPGSLIQQDIGEPTFGHGFILWNLAKNRGKLFHVPNDYGSFTMRQDGAGGWRVRFGLRDTQPLETVSYTHLTLPTKA